MKCTVLLRRAPKQALHIASPYAVEEKRLLRRRKLTPRAPPREISRGGE